MILLCLLLVELLTAMPLLLASVSVLVLLLPPRTGVAHGCCFRSNCNNSEKHRYVVDVLVVLVVRSRQDL
jgi:hypothetical protein